RALVASGRASRLPGEPGVIQLAREVTVPGSDRERSEPPAPGTGMLLHVCCGPCATYPVPRLRSLGFDLVGYWYNPNIYPAEEHARRQASALAYARAVGLELRAGPYEPERFEQAVQGGSVRPERCRRCYRLRLEAAAREAARLGIPAITTTLLISPYQDQGALREIGEEVAGRHGVSFYFENLRRGWAERGRLARQYGLYLQQYCGCRFSLAERDERRRRVAGPAEGSEVPAAAAPGERSRARREVE
ncbi:MAG: epoxyqueuosine reductase QueH, partial [Anaerolineae bacterium]|nr:epoxyqueuosine reductase QueH [Anaerolineae bacterium]